VERDNPVGHRVGLAWLRWPMLSTGPCRTTPSHPAPAPVGLPLVLAALVAACGPPAPEIAEPAPVSRPDLVLITLDTVRADRVGAYGDPHARTPNLDRLAAQSALFREATTPVPLTLPAHASLLTGLYPHRHGLRDNGGFRLASTVPVVTTTLAESGYHTGAFVGAYVLDAA